MGNGESICNTKEEIQSLKIGNHSITTVGIQGYRETMEDSVLIEPLNRKGWYFALVFDGHGGNAVSKYLKDNFINIFKYMHMWETIQKSQCEPSDNDVISLICDFCFIMDEEIKLNIEGSKVCGSTCSGVLMTPTKYYTINIGDSRTVLLRNSEVIELTNDHKPDNKNERERIYKAGSFVFKGRISGILAVSRAFGDFAFKEEGELSYKDRPVICHPDVNVHPITSDDQYIIIGCDGLWDNYSSKRCGQRLLEIEANIDFYIKQRAFKELEKMEIELKLLKSANVENLISLKDYSMMHQARDDFIIKELNNEIENLDDDDISTLSDLEKQLFINSELVQSAVESKDNVSVILIKLS